jgi:hypothetical protein
VRHSGYQIFPGRSQIGGDQRKKLDLTLTESAFGEGAAMIANIAPGVVSVAGMQESAGSMLTPHLWVPITRSRHAM